MANFEKCFEILIGHEGGYVNDPLDPGGETKFGISKRSYPNEDIKNLTIERAKEIYKRDFWDKINLDKINSFDVCLSIFDFAVNAGSATAAKLAQRTVGVDDDGIIGSGTILAINKYDEEKFVYKYAILKIKRYISICEKTPTSKKYFYGWTIRACSNLK